MFSIGLIILLCGDVGDNNTMCVDSRTSSCQLCYAIDLSRRLSIFIRVFVRFGDIWLRISAGDKTTLA